MKSDPITMERTFDATLREVWGLWTTKAGIESWWGPDGFQVRVLELDLRAGGGLVYTMTAVAPPQIAFMQQANMPLTTTSRITFSEVTPPSRLVYEHLTDFIPGVAPYDVTHRVELESTTDGVRLVLTFDAMHDETWTQRATMGWESELDRLAGALEAR